jgi:hypothetical protein
MTGKEKREEKERSMSIWVFVMIIAVWFLLQAYILPKFGIST